MKKIIEKVVEKDQSVVELLANLSNSDNWVYIDIDVYHYLKENFRHEAFDRADGRYFYDDKTGSEIAVRTVRGDTRLKWYEVGTTYGDPEEIYFFSV